MNYLLRKKSWRFLLKRKNIINYLLINWNWWEQRAYPGPCPYKDVGGGGLYPAAPYKREDILRGTNIGARGRGPGGGRGSPDVLDGVRK